MRGLVPASTFPSASSRSQSDHSLRRTSSSSAPSSSGTRSGPPPDVPKGSLAVYVGEEEKRFVIPISYLKHPFLLALLKQSEEEFGFCHSGAMHLPCDVSVFYRVLKRIEQECPPRIKLPLGPMGLIVP